MSPPSGTLKPTAARVRSFRDRGDIARSRDAVAATALAGALLGLWLTAEHSWAAIVTLVERACHQPTPDAAGEIARRCLVVAAHATLPALAGAVAGALLAIAAQLGWPPVFWPFSRARRGDADAATPLAQLRRAFGPAAVARRALTTLAKLAAIAGAAFLAFSGPQTLAIASPQQLLAATATAVAAALLAATAVLFALGLLEYIWARRRLQRRMLMTHDDLRRELRELEGDPAIKARRQRRRQELARRREPQLAQADLVVTSPGKLAIALRYRFPDDEAPLVVTAAAGEQADDLAAAAAERAIPTLVRPALARALERVAPGQLIPPPLYRAVAEALATADEQAPPAPARGASPGAAR
jgi:flagellar biosynthesis protein FlhB